MHYFDTDFYTLMTLGRVGKVNAEALLREMARELGWMASADYLSSALAAMEASGYVTLATEDKILRADTVVSITDPGRALIRLGGMANVFSGIKQKAVRKNEKVFCTLVRPAVAPLSIDRASFADYTESVNRDQEVTFLGIDNNGEGVYELSLNHAYYRETDAEEADADSVSVLCDLDGLHNMLGALLDTALFFTESRKPRKVVLSGGGKAYVATFCEVADTSGFPVMRVTAAPILFNRQRFIGKRDSDLDYAQCGDNALSTTFDSTSELCGCILGEISKRCDLLNEELAERIHELYRKFE